MTGELYNITPVDTTAVPPFKAMVEKVDDTPPDGGPPPGQLPDAKARWEYSGGEGGGWYFCWGPFDKPQPLPGLGPAGVVSINLDPLKSGWQTLDGLGWTFVSGPYDKPMQVYNVKIPDPPVPPDQPPVDPGCRWTYTAAGWVLICGPYDKPKPVGPGEGNGAPPAK